jgi:hypothetical protein
MERGSAFCPGCGAPQIRVIAPEVEPIPQPALTDDAPLLPQPLLTQDSAFHIGPGSWRAIEWRSFLRISLPLAFLAGTLTAFLLPLGLAMLPASVILALARYRKERCPRMTPAQGGWLGACTGLLSFLVFLIFAGIQAALNRAEMRQAMINGLQEQLARNPDPNFHQAANWLITPAGMVFLLALSMMVFLALFVGLATVTGTLAAAISGNRGRR